MRFRWSAPAALLALSALLAVAFTAAAGAGTAPAQEVARQDAGLGTAHNLAGPLTKEFEARREAALEMKLRGEAKGKVARLGKNKYVELVREKTDPVFVVIAEFGNARHSSFCDAVANPAPPQPCAFPSDGSPQRYDGPAHNAIDPPNRSIDNSTLWQSDYNPAHYKNMYFNRMAEYFEQQSSNRYSVMAPGDAVHGWVKVPFNEARYGRDFCGGIVCNSTWFLIRDAMSYWVQGQVAEGKTDAQIAAYLKQFDVWDRYDLDGDGNFDEPDNFIDHFQIVHAGGDQAAGDPHQGTDAIWSHRWYASVQGGGPGGLPGVNIGSGGASGGLPGGIPHHPVDVWVGDYTIQPENGGLGVFTHEYAHDLGLPDLYDTSGNTGGAENSTAFWTLMSSGANIGDGGRNGIGDAPVDLGAWEKFQLGWLGCDTCAGGKFYDTVDFRENKKLKLGPNDAASKLGLQAAFALLPDKRLDTVITAPKTGSFLYWSTMGDEIHTSMTKAYTVPAGATLTADVWFDIEEHFDFAFLEQSTNGGTTWTPVLTNLSSPASEDQSGFNSSGTGIDGVSGGLPAADGESARLGCLADPVPVPDRPGSHRHGLRDRQHRGHRQPARRCRGCSLRLDVQRLQADDRHGDQLPPERVRDGEPAVRRVRPVAPDRVQLRVPDHGPARLGRALPVPGRPADQLLGRDVHRQQRRRSSRRRSDPAGGRASDAGALVERPAHASAHPVVRLDLRAREDGSDHPEPERRADDDQVEARRAGVQRPAVVLDR